MGELTPWIQKIIRAKEVENKTSLTGGNFDEIASLNDMDTDFNNGYTCFVSIKTQMINSQREDNPFGNIQKNAPYPDHWVIYNGGLNKQDGKIKFDIYSWGKSSKDGDKNTDKNLIINIDEETFKDTYFGYIKFKI